MVHVAFQKPSICFINLSTCHAITENENRGFFGEEIVEKTIQLLEQNPEVRDARFRIGLWHHNLRPKDGTAIVDVHRTLSRFIDRHPRIDMALHGHTHRGTVDEYRPPRTKSTLPFSSVGSFGVVAEYRDGDEEHGRVACEFAVIDLEIRGTTFRYTTTYYRLDLNQLDEWKWQEDRQETYPFY